MGKFGKNKFKALNKIAKTQKKATGNVTNKVLKRKANAVKKVTFQREVLLKEAASSPNLAQNVTAKAITLKELTKKSKKQDTIGQSEEKKSKSKSVEKQKKRQKTQISDTKMLLNLMKKKD